MLLFCCKTEKHIHIRKHETKSRKFKYLDTATSLQTTFSCLTPSYKDLNLNEWPPRSQFYMTLHLEVKYFEENLTLIFTLKGSRREQRIMLPISCSSSLQPFCAIWLLIHMNHTPYFGFLDMYWVATGWTRQEISNSKSIAQSDPQEHGSLPRSAARLQHSTRVGSWLIEYNGEEIQTWTGHFKSL